MAVRKSMLQRQRNLVAAFRGALRCSSWLRAAPREFVVRVKSQLAVVSESHWASSRSSSWSRQQDSSLIVAARRHIIMAARGRVERTIIASRRLVVAQESLSLGSTRELVVAQCTRRQQQSEHSRISGGERDSEGKARVFGGERDLGVVIAIKNGNHQRREEREPLNNGLSSSMTKVDSWLFLSKQVCRGTRRARQHQRGPGCHHSTSCLRRVVSVSESVQRCRLS
jgi:hypothetical protein